MMKEQNKTPKQEFQFSLNDDAKQKILNILRRRNIIIVLFATFITLAFSSVILQMQSLLFVHPFFLFFLAILAIISIIFLNRNNKQLKELVGENILKPLISSVFNVKSYSANTGIAKEKIREANLIYRWDTYNGNDFVSGTYKDVDIEFSDLHLQEQVTTTDSKGNTQTSYETRFKGQWLICDFKRELSAHIRLRENRERMIFGGYSKSKSDITTENINFNEKFQILTDDGHTAFYILTPHFIELILQIDEIAKAQTFIFFGKTQVHIALHSSRDLFEIKSRDLKEIEKIYQNFLRELRLLTDIIDELLTNDKLFK